MENKTNYGKIIAVTLAVITSAVTISYVIYRLLHNLIAFRASFDEIDEAAALEYDEMDEDFDPAEIFAELDEEFETAEE